MVQPREHVYTPGAMALIAVLRALSPVGQYQLLLNHATPLLARLGLRAAPLYVLKQGAGFGQLGTVPSLLVLTSAIGAFKHIWWASRCELAMPVAGSIFVGVFNFLLEASNSLAAAWVLGRAGARPASELGPLQVAGFAAFIAGIALELGSEEARRLFKKDPANKGKVHTTGPQSFVRFPNYAGYLLWHIGAAACTGSLGWTVGMGLLTASMFAFSTVDLGNHMRKRYGEQYVAYEKRVTSKIIPGVW